MRSPFWLLVIGMGTAWVIGTGRAQAVWTILLAPPNQSPSTTPPPYEVPNNPYSCSPGQHWDSALLACVPDNPT